MTRLYATFATALLGIAQFSACAAPAKPGELVVFAAASLSDVMRELAMAYVEGGGRQPVFNFAGSNALAQQLLAAPRGQVFVSADRDWLDVLDRRGLLVEGSRRPVFTNRLVLITRGDAPIQAGLDCPGALLSADGARLALADPAAVPAGRYARAALASLGDGDGTLWQRVAQAAIPTSDARAALALVEATPGLLGIVYRTDAAASSRVRVLCDIETAPGRPIIYWAAVVEEAPDADRDPSDGASSFLEFLAAPEARRVIERHGFGALDS